MNETQIDTSVLDRNAFVGRLGGDPELVAEVVQLFLMRYESAMNDIRSAVRCVNLKLLERAAHLLRGYFVSFQAQRASEAAHALEIKGRLGDAQNIILLLENLEREVRLLIPAIKDVAEGGGPLTVSPRPTTSSAID